MKTAIFSLAVLLIFSGSAFAVLVVDDGFDTYESQEQFEAVWTPIGTVAPASADLSGGFALSSPNSVHIASGLDGQRRNQLTFSPSPVLNVGDQLIWSFDYWDNFPIGLPRPNYASLQTIASPDGSQAGQVLSLGLNSNQNQDNSGGNFYMASISDYSHPADDDVGPDEDAVGTGSGAFFKLNDTGVGLRGEDAAWHNFKVVITTNDGNTADHAYFVDGALAETVTGVGPLQQYGVINLGSGRANGTQVFFDNMRLEFVQGAAVPEASALAAMGLVGLLTAGTAWIRTRRAGF